MESVGDARSFFSAAREVALSQTDHRDQGRALASSLTRSRIAHRRTHRQRRSARRGLSPLAAVLRVHNIADLFYMAEVLGRQPRPKGPRLTILTNAGGPAVLATDSLVANGGELADAFAGEPAPAG